MQKIACMLSLISVLSKIKSSLVCSVQAEYDAAVTNFYQAITVDT
jgi:hypothetical protein